MAIRDVGGRQSGGSEEGQGEVTRPPPDHIGEDEEPHGEGGQLAAPVRGENHLIPPVEEQRPENERDVANEDREDEPDREAALEGQVQDEAPE